MVYFLTVFFQTVLFCTVFFKVYPAYLFSKLSELVQFNQCWENELQDKRYFNSLAVWGIQDWTNHWSTRDDPAHMRVSEILHKSAENCGNHDLLIDHNPNVWAPFNATTKNGRLIGHGWFSVPRSVESVPTTTAPMSSPESWNTIQWKTDFNR